MERGVSIRAAFLGEGHTHGIGSLRCLRKCIAGFVVEELTSPCYRTV